MEKKAGPAYDLSDAEKRDLIALIQQGKPLPEKYRFILFEDKREVELVCNGKTSDVCTAVLLFQTLEHVDEPRAETKRQEERFDPRGRQLRGWANKLGKQGAAEGGVYYPLALHRGGYRPIPPGRAIFWRSSGDPMDSGGNSGSLPIEWNINPTAPSKPHQAISTP
ncbi:MAG: hypothetical protein U5L05_10170 [Rubrivivax sp.]|nr:hypothetical protein [Rubrivivax sp.]